MLPLILLQFCSNFHTSIFKCQKKISKGKNFLKNFFLLKIRFMMCRIRICEKKIFDFFFREIFLSVRKVQVFFLGAIEGNILEDFCLWNSFLYMGQGIRNHEVFFLKKIVSKKSTLVPILRTLLLLSCCVLHYPRRYLIY